MVRLALAQVRIRPASFVAVAATALLAVATITAFSSLIAADIATPAHVKGTTSGDDASLGVIAGIFGEGAIAVSLFVMLNCIGFALRQQLRDLALLRTVAATPRQVRRLVRRQVLLVVAAVAPLGWIAGSVGAHWFLQGLKDHGYAAAGIETPGSPLPFVIATGVTAAIAVGASAVGVRRVNRLSPAAALSETSTEPGRVGWCRVLLGGGALAGAAGLLGVSLAEGGVKAADGSFLALMVLLLALGLLGPIVAGIVGRVLGRVPRLVAPRIGWLADAHLRGHSRRLASAVVPVALLVGLACNFLFVGPTMDQAGSAEARRELQGLVDADENWLRLVELGMFALLASVAIVNTLVALTVERRSGFRQLRLLGATTRDLWRMLIAETAVIAGAGLVLGTLVGGATLVVFSQAVTGSPVPSVPMASYAAIVAGTVAVTAPSILVTGRRALARSEHALAA